MLKNHQQPFGFWLIPVGITVLIAAGVVVLRGLPSFPPQDPVTQTVTDTPVQPTKTFPKAPQFTLKDYADNEVSLSDFAGTPMVLNSWATWCPFCKEELSDFADVADEFDGQVVVLAINRGESRQTSKEYTDAFQVTNRITFLLDPTDAFYEAIGGISMPETLFLDRDGRVRYHARGPVQKDEFRRQVELLIKEG